MYTVGRVYSGLSPRHSHPGPVDEIIKASKILHFEFLISHSVVVWFFRGSATRRRRLTAAVVAMLSREFVSKAQERERG